MSYDEADLAAARDVLWPDRTAANALSSYEQQMLERVATTLADLSADADDAWRHAREAEREAERLRSRLTPAGATVVGAEATVIGQVYLNGAWREVCLAEGKRAVEEDDVEPVERLAHWLHGEFDSGAEDSDLLPWAQESEGVKARYRHAARALRHQLPELFIQPDEQLDPVAVRAVAEEQSQPWGVDEARHRAALREERDAWQGWTEQREEQPGE